MSYIILGSFINLNVASIFAYKLLSLGSSFRKSRRCLYRILAQSFAGNVTSGTLAMLTALLWISREDFWFLIPAEILAKIYPLVLLCALLARVDMRADPVETHSGQMNAGAGAALRIDTMVALDFLDEDARRWNSSGSVEISSSPEEMSRFLFYRPREVRRRRR